MVKKAHADFLRGCGVQADVEAIKRFHPDFKLENLSPVPMIELPKPKGFFNVLRLQPFSLSSDTNTFEALGAKDLLARTKSAAEEAAARLPEKVRVGFISLSNPEICSGSDREADEATSKRG